MLPLSPKRRCPNQAENEVHGDTETAFYIIRSQRGSHLVVLGRFVKEDSVHFASLIRNTKREAVRRPMSSVGFPGNTAAQEHPRADSWKEQDLCPIAKKIRFFVTTCVQLKATANSARLCTSRQRNQTPPRGCSAFPPKRKKKRLRTQLGTSNEHPALQPDPRTGRGGSVKIKSQGWIIE